MIVAEEPSPRFLGMTTAERNRRLAQRHGGRLDAGPGELALARLIVPPDAAITAELFPILEAAAERACRITWHPAHPPLLWLPAGTQTSPLDVRAADGAAVLDVSSARARRRATWHLLQQSGKPQDGWLSRHVHRRVSRPFSYVFLQLGLSANAATMFAFAIGLLAAYCMSRTSHATMVAGGALFWFASIADGIDGEVARLTLSESRFGEQLDTGVDQLTYLAGLAGVVTGWWRQGMGPGGAALAVVVVAGTPALLLWAMTIVRRARRTGQFFVPTKPIETAIFRSADDTGAMALRATATVFVLFRREAFSFAFFVLSLFTAQRVAIPAAIAAGLLIVAVTFTAYAATLDRTLREIVGPRPADTTTARPPRDSAARA